MTLHSGTKRVLALLGPLMLSADVNPTWEAGGDLGESENRFGRKKEKKCGKSFWVWIVNSCMEDIDFPASLDDILILVGQNDPWNGR